MSSKLGRLIVLASAALCGCVATQQNISDLQGQMDTLQVEMNKLRQTMESVQKNQADLVVKMDQVHTDLGQFSEQVSGFRDQMTSLNSRMDDLKTSIDVNTQTMTKRQAAAAAAASAAQTTASAGDGGVVQSPSDLFKGAQAQLEKKQYDLAVQGFQLYLKNNAKGSLADQAQYSIGEAFFAQTKYPEAARAYAQVLDGFPSSSLTAAARLRYALSILKMDPSKKQEAQRYLESIQDDFPGTPEAAKAQEYLANLGKQAAASTGTTPSPSPQ
jgi:TolA-binding protein